MVEGQGRIVWGYKTIFKLVFDLVLIIFVSKSLLKQRKLVDVKKVPSFYIFLIAGHFFWYLIQFFNYRNVGLIGVIAATKIYIFPFILFFSLINNPISYAERNIKTIKWFAIIFLILQALLTLHQFEMGDTFIYGVHPYYKTIVGEKFSGNLYRSFGTTWIPGGPSIFYLFMIGFLFISKSSSFIEKFFTFLTIGLTIASAFILQVRSAMIKEFLVIIMIYVCYTLFSKNRLRYALPIIAIFMSIPMIFNNVDKIQKIFPNLNLEQSIQRFSSLGNIEQASSSRITVSEFGHQLSKKLRSSPFGLGPGRTGSVASLTAARVKNDPVYNLAFAWSFDNLFLSLAIDLGIGMIFYVLIITTMPFYLFWLCYKNYVAGKPVNILIPSFVMSFVILIGAWGAINIPYNPASFFYWVWVSMGINHYKETNKVS